METTEEIRSLPDRPPRLCPSCGARVAEGAKTCLMCGAELEEEAATAAVAPTAPKRLGRNQLIILSVVAAVILTGSVLVGWNLSQSKVVPTPTATPTSTTTPTITPTPTVTPTPTPTPTPPPTPTPVPPLSYTVKRGDSLLTIAQTFGITVDELRAFNGMDSDFIVQGETLLIPPPTPTPGPTPTPEPGQPTATPAPFIVYVVQQGDALSTIAERYGVSISVIRAANGMSANSDTIRVGDTLIIPQYTPTPQPTAVMLVGEGTPTPRAAYPAPTLLFPPEGTTFAGANTVILLQWLSVGVLQAGEYYQVTFTYPAINGPVTVTEYVRATAWRVPAELFPSEALVDRTCTWQVAVVRQVKGGTAPEYQAIGPVSPVRSLVWTAVQP